jgi:hypothetical protein
VLARSSLSFGIFHPGSHRLHHHPSFFSHIPYWGRGGPGHKKTRFTTELHSHQTHQLGVPQGLSLKLKTVLPPSRHPSNASIGTPLIKSAARSPFNGCDSHCECHHHPACEELSRPSTCCWTQARRDATRNMQRHAQVLHPSPAALDCEALSGICSAPR